MAKIQGQAPYNDSYEQERLNDYSQVLFRPGVVAQAREVNVIQSMAKDFVGRIGNALYKDGSVVSGCEVIVNGTNLTITSGMIYLDELVRRVPEQRLTITGVGREIIGVKLITTIVTELDDNTLRDPAEGMINNGNPGAHRLKETVEFHINASDAVPVFTLIDGALLVKKEENNTDMLNSILARRTYDENGNFKITGLELSERKEVRDNKILVSLSQGKAYVEGFEVIKGYTTVVPVNFSKETRLVNNEPKGYQSSQKKYKLNNQPVAEFVKVVAEVEHTQSVTRGNISGGIDYLDKSPVTSVVSVKQGGTTYNQGTDFQLTGDGIDWSLNGNDPATGTTYQVVYKYNKSLEQGVDIQLINENGVNYLEFFTGGDKPVNNTTFTIDYKFYLARKDLICLNKDGEVSVYEGKSDVMRLTETPLNFDVSNLVVGSVLVLPNSNEVVINNFNTTRLDQSQLYNMLRRIYDIEYNQALSDLDTQAIEGETATQLKGVYTDGFIGLTKSDVSNSEFNCTIDVDRAELTLPVTQNIYPLYPNWNSLETKVGRFGRVVTAPFNHEKIYSQRLASEVFKVNPYSVFSPMIPLKLNPEVDNWIDEEKISVNKEMTKSTTLRRWWYHRGESWAESEKIKWQQLGYADGGESLGWSAGVTSSTKSTSEVVMDSAIMYMRQREVEVTATNFNPNQDNIECYFNETKIPLTPVGTTLAGSTSGTVRADANGELKAKFTVIKGTPCGVVPVKLKSGTFEGVTSYQAQGRSQKIQDTVLTEKTVANPIDPLAQSFQFDEDKVITKIGLYFKNKDNTRAVTVQVRNMVNGYPGQIVYAEEIMKPANINVSDDGTAETVLALTNPVHCKANNGYSICILSDSDEYTMWVATLGQKDVVSKEHITSNSYLAGVLFSSSNGSTWTAHQSSDLKFDLYSPRYTGSGQVVFDDVDSLTMSRVVLAAQSVDFKNSGLTWLFKVGDKDNWLPIDTYSERELNVQAHKISLKVIINIKDNNSPILAFDVINLIALIDKTQGSYVSRTVEMSEKYTKIKVMVDVAIPSSTSYKIFYKAEDVSNNWVELTSPQVSPVNEDFNKHTYNATLSGSGAKKYKIKIEMTTTNPLVKPRFKKLMSILKY
nr:MAG TPA: protein of unknown function (DUF4815) [Caudoviricetes sp.]